MRVTWVWANNPDDESGTDHPVQQGRSSARRTPRSSIENDTPRHERNTRHV